jgi:hypothetical protein
MEVKGNINIKREEHFKGKKVPEKRRLMLGFFLLVGREKCVEKF